MDLQTLLHTAVQTAEAYGVDPLTFGIIYVVAIPLFLASVAWLVRSARGGRPLAMPAACASFSFFSSYLYILMMGENMPVWVYVLIGVMVVYGIGATFLKVRWQLRKHRDKPEAASNEPACSAP